MKAGKLRHRITFQKPKFEDSGHGGKAKGWENVATVWAEIKPVSGREYFENFQMESEISTKITIRYLAGLNTHMRIKFGDRYFKIVTPPINPQESNRVLEIMALETEDFN